MNQPRPLSKAARWAAVLVATLFHPAWLVLMLPVLGDAANLESVVAPLLTVWLFRLRAGLVILLANVISSCIVFARLAHQGPREGLPRTFIATFIMASLCWLVDRARQYFDKGRLMRDEIERMRNSSS
jgi:hypothetical protein